jgi:hypothetical protein
MEPGALDIVVRLYETTDLPRLERCVFSLVGQGCGRRRVHLMLQRFSIAEVQAVRAALQPLLDLDEDLGLILHNWQHAEPFDLRVPLLNLAVQVARSRYLTCIEAGDVVLPGAFAALLARLQAAAEAVAVVGGMATQRVSWWGDVVLPHPVATAPPADPFEHTGDGATSSLFFVLDRTRLPVQRLTFEASRPGAELVDFLNRLSADCVVDVAAAAETFGLRQVPL